GEAAGAGDGRRDAVDGDVDLRRAADDLDVVPRAVGQRAVDEHEVVAPLAAELDDQRGRGDADVPPAGGDVVAGRALADDALRRLAGRVERQRDACIARAEAADLAVHDDRVGAVQSERSVGAGDGPAGGVRRRVRPRAVVRGGRVHGVVV